MKWIKRIATLFFVIALGVNCGPGALANEDGDDASTHANATYKKTNFKGIRIYSNPADKILYHLTDNKNSIDETSAGHDAKKGDKHTVKIFSTYPDNQFSDNKNVNCCKQKKMNTQ